MADFKMKGSDLYDKTNHKLATIRGSNIYDARNHKVASIRGSDIYDERNHKIAKMDDVRKSVGGGMGGASLAALWLFFIR